MYESQESRSCRTDSRPVSRCDEEDAKPSVSTGLLHPFLGMGPGPLELGRIASV